jgi:hypothetical protein
MIVRWQSALREAFAEACRCIAGSPHSRQLEALRQLDDRLLADIGHTREEAGLRRPERRQSGGKAARIPRLRR